MGNALSDISKAGVAVWLDDLSRERLQNGSLKKLIESDYVVGVTTNPSIFASAIGKSDLYQTDILRNALLSTEEIITRYKPSRWQSIHRSRSKICSRY